MNENDFDRTARLWLEDGPTVISDRPLQAALDEIHGMRQRRAWWPARRVFDMNATTRLAGLAAALVVAVVLGINFQPGGSGTGGGPAATPTPALTPAPTPAPTPTPAPIAFPLFPQLLVVSERGTYLISDPFPISVTISVPAGWVGKVGGPYAAYLDRATAGAAIAFSLSQRIYADPCGDRGFLDPQPGPTVDDLSTALASLPGLEVTTPTEITVDGYRGMQLTLIAPDAIDGCISPPDGYPLWQLPLGTVFFMTPGQHVALWILDVEGERLVVSSDTFPANTAQEQAEVQQILDSIRIANLN